MKTLAVRLEDALHAQLSVIAQLDEQTVTDIIRRAIETHIEERRSAPELTAKANEILADIDRDAAARRTAISALFGEPEPSKPPTKRSARREETPTET